MVARMHLIVALYARSNVAYMIFRFQWVGSDSFDVQYSVSIRRPVAVALCSLTTTASYD